MFVHRKFSNCWDEKKKYYFLVAHVDGGGGGGLRGTLVSKPAFSLAAAIETTINGRRKRKKRGPALFIYLFFSYTPRVLKITRLILAYDYYSPRFQVRATITYTCTNTVRTRHKKRAEQTTKKMFRYYFTR